LPICSASSVCRTRSARFCSVKDSAPRSACPSPACLARIFTISSCVAYTKSGSLNAPQVVAFELFFLSLLSWGFMRRGYCQQSGLVRHAKQTGYYISWELRLVRNSYTQVSDRSARCCSARTLLVLFANRPSFSALQLPTCNNVVVADGQRIARSVACIDHFIHSLGPPTIVVFITRQTAEIGLFLHDVSCDIPQCTFFLSY